LFENWDYIEIDISSLDYYTSPCVPRDYRLINFENRFLFSDMRAVFIFAKEVIIASVYIHALVDGTIN